MDKTKKEMIRTKRRRNSKQKTELLSATAQKMEKSHRKAHQTDLLDQSPGFSVNRVASSA